MTKNIVPESKVCPICGRTFTIEDCDINNKRYWPKRIHCSAECYHRSAVKRMACSHGGRKDKNFIEQKKFYALAVEFNKKCPDWKLAEFLRNAIIDMRCMERNNDFHNSGCRMNGRILFCER